MWQQAVDLDLLPQGVKKIWLATGDDRTCPVCAVMDGQTVEVSGGEFNVNRQAIGFIRSGSSFRVSGTKPYRGWGKQQSPPGHPMCRCTMILETIDTPRQTATPQAQQPITISDADRAGVYRKLEDQSDDPTYRFALDHMKQNLDAHPDGDAFLSKVNQLFDSDDGLTIKVADKLPESNRGFSVNQKYGGRVGDLESKGPFIGVSSQHGGIDMAVTLQHEFTHQIDHMLYARAGEASFPMEAAQRLFADGMFKGQLAYAVTEPGEGVADIVSFYLGGTSPGVGAATASEFAEKAPELAAWAKGYLQR